jgi:hypothetical protein
MNIEPLDSGSFKYHTCKFKSENKIKRVIKRCACQGGDYEIHADYCNKLDVFDLTPDICELCDHYESK